MKATQHEVTIDATEITRRYQRAQTIMQGLYTQKLVQNDNLLPHWIEHTECFWYRRADKTGKAFRLVDAKAKTNTPAFDHAALAAALANSAQQRVDAEDLPFSYITLTLSPLTVRFTAFDRHWQFNNESQTCQEERVTLVGKYEVLSPDGKWIAFTRDNNLWVRDFTSGEERALTDDGKEDYSYGGNAAPYGKEWLSTGLGGAQWSPDSQRLFVLQRDTRQVKTLPVVNHIPQNGSLRPTVEHTKIAYPGDEHVESYRLLAINVATGQQCEADYQHIPVSVADTGFLTWAKLGGWRNDSRHTWFIDQERGDRVLRLVEFDTTTGATRILFSETSDTHITIKPDIVDFPLHMALPETDELIWWSERSDWGHLYLYDLRTGKLKQTITRGDWRVRAVLQFDQKRRELWVQTAGRSPGRNPYYQDICRVNIDTGELTPLASSDHEYLIHPSGLSVMIEQILGEGHEHYSGIAPSGNYVVATRTRADQPSVHLLFDREGKPVLELETAHTTHLPEGWSWPEPVTLTAADGQTAIYAVLFRPSNFDEDKSYPVINLIVSGPWWSAVPHGSFHACRCGSTETFYFQAAALAELGFIVVIIDSRGTPLRNKAFEETSYGWIPSGANTADHRTAIEQLAKRYPAMDLTRVGIYSPSGYPGALQNAFECPDFYQVAISNHHQDSRLITSIEGDTYHGMEGPTDGNRFPEQLVEQWKGKLLLIQDMVGGSAMGYPPASTFRLVDALRQANKDFDLLIVPTSDTNNYEVRRTWDFLIRHLQGVEPPKEFKLEGFSW